jgi:Glycosyl hydrolases family 18
MTWRRTLELTTGVLVAVAALAQPAAAARAATAAQGEPLPWHVYAPYVETWTADSIPQLAAQSGARYFSLAFIQTASAGSCALTWDGDSTRPIPGSDYQAQIAQLRQVGGDVIPTFGGYSADTTNTEIADSCTNVATIAADYESLITTYHITRLDMDVEANSLTNTAGIDRRNQAIALVEAWARSQRLPLQVQYTLPVEPTGLVASELALLRNAIADGARVDIVNIMTFDYYLASEPSPLNMAAEAISAADNARSQLAAVYAGSRQPRLGITIMPGIDDYPGKTEITYLQDARQILWYAWAHGLATLSIWAIERDNGGCPGTVGANSCSGIAQPTWAFSHLLKPFIR